MFKHIFSAALLMLGGCATLPDLVPDDELNFRDIYFAVRCEIKAAATALLPSHPAIANWNVVLGLNIIARDNANYNPDLAFVSPFVKAKALLQGLAEITTHAKIGTEASRTVTIKSFFLVSDLDRIGCQNAVLRNKPHQLSSELGIYEVLRRSLEAVDTPDSIDELAVVSTKIGFVFDAGGDATARFTGYRLKGTGDPGSINGAPFISGSRHDDHSLELTMGPPIYAKP